MVADLHIMMLKLSSLIQTMVCPIYVFLSRQIGLLYIYIRNFIELNFNLYCFSTYTVDVDTDANGTRKLDKILF